MKYCNVLMSTEEGIGYSEIEYPEAVYLNEEDAIKALETSDKRCWIMEVPIYE